MPALTSLSGWGRHPPVAGRLIVPNDIMDVAGMITAEPNLIARGNGRAYGDAAINPRATLGLHRCARVISFDPQTGLLTAEAGLLLADLITLVLPLGWFPPVSPGTKFVTLGGMLASDVHGKNHHLAGSFGAHVTSCDLALADGSVRQCSPTADAALFAATRGGMGLTGVIVRMTVQLLRVETPLMRQRTFRAANLTEAMAAFERETGATYSVAWIDCLARGASLGRALIYLGEHARADEVPPHTTLTVPRRRRFSVPVDLPNWALNRWTARAFNEVYWRRAQPGTMLVDYDSYFYPLDSLRDWNRIYGRRGFVQFQCVLPRSASLSGLTALLEVISAAGAGSFLSVLKLFGAGVGMLSFPMAGYTLALDFPASADNFTLLRRLDAIVADHGGRVYLAKDACTDAALFRKSYPDLNAFRHVRQQVDPFGRFASLQSLRLGI